MFFAKRCRGRKFGKWRGAACAVKRAAKERRAFRSFVPRQKRASANFARCVARAHFSRIAAPIGRKNSIITTAKLSCFAWRVAFEPTDFPRFSLTFFESIRDFRDYYGTRCTAITAITCVRSCTIYFIMIITRLCCVVHNISLVSMFMPRWRNAGIGMAVKQLNLNIKMGNISIKGWKFFIFRDFRDCYLLWS